VPLHPFPNAIIFRVDGEPFEPREVWSTGAACAVPHFLILLAFQFFSIFWNNNNVHRGLKYNFPVINGSNEECR